jgi:hypothetical protein
MIQFIHQLKNMDHAFFFFLFVVLGLELIAFTLSHSTKPIFCDSVTGRRGQHGGGKA